jgi:hypothetical protein
MGGEKTGLRIEDGRGRRRGGGWVIVDADRRVRLACLRIGLGRRYMRLLFRTLYSAQHQVPTMYPNLRQGRNRTGDEHDNHRHRHTLIQQGLATYIAYIAQSPCCKADADHNPGFLLASKSLVGEEASQTCKVLPSRPPAFILPEIHGRYDILKQATACSDWLVASAAPRVRPFWSLMAVFTCTAVHVSRGPNTALGIHMVSRPLAMQGPPLPRSCAYVMGSFVQVT